MKLEDIFENQRKSTAFGDVKQKDITPEAIVAALGGTENAPRVMGAIVELETEGFFNDITFDEIVKRSR